jgi:hypothetical protein
LERKKGLKSAETYDKVAGEVGRTAEGCKGQMKLWLKVDEKSGKIVLEGFGFTVGSELAQFLSNPKTFPSPEVSTSLGFLHGSFQVHYQEAKEGDSSLQKRSTYPDGGHSWGVTRLAAASGRGVDEEA